MFMTIMAALLSGASPSLPSVVAELASEPRYTSEAIGYSGTRSPAYELYSQLILIADDEDLRALLDHESAVVRLYAFQGLIHRDFAAAPLIAELRAKEDPVDTQYGCSQWRSRVGQIAKQIVEDRASLRQRAQER
jgi:hypothetical protein